MTLKELMDDIEEAKNRLERIINEDDMITRGTIWLPSVGVVDLFETKSNDQQGV